MSQAADDMPFIFRIVKRGSWTLTLDERLGVLFMPRNNGVQWYASVTAAQRRLPEDVEDYSELMLALDFLHEVC